MIVSEQGAVSEQDWYVLTARVSRPKSRLGVWPLCIVRTWRPGAAACPRRIPRRRRRRHRLYGERAAARFPHVPCLLQPLPPSEGYQWRWRAQQQARHILRVRRRKSVESPPQHLSPRHLQLLQQPKPASKQQPQVSSQPRKSVRSPLQTLELSVTLLRRGETTRRVRRAEVSRRAPSRCRRPGLGTRLRLRPGNLQSPGPPLPLLLLPEGCTLQQRRR